MTRPNRVVLSTSGDTSRTLPSKSPYPRNRNDSLLIDLDVFQFGFDDLGVEFDFTVLDDAEHRLADGRRHRADARRAAADDAVLGCGHIGIASTPHDFATLRFDLRLVGLGSRQSVTRRDQLCSRRAGSTFALIVGRAREIARLLQRLGAHELSLRLLSPGLRLARSGF